MFYMLDSENIPTFKTDRLITCQMGLSRLRTLQSSFRSNVGGIRTDCNRWVVSYLHTETHSWPQLCPVLQCWDTAHRTADPPCPDMYQGDTGRTAPAPRCRTCPRHSSLRRRTQVSVSEDYFVLQGTAAKTYRTFLHGGLVLCCRSRHYPGPWTVFEPPHTPCRRTECRTAVC